MSLPLTMVPKITPLKGSQPLQYLVSSFLLIALLCVPQIINVKHLVWYLGYSRVCSNIAASQVDRRWPLAGRQKRTERSTTVKKTVKPNSEENNLISGFYNISSVGVTEMSIS